MDDCSLTYRRLFGRFPTGVAVVLADSGGEIVGLTVNSLTSVSLDPLLLLFCISNESLSGGVIVRTGSFTVNMLTDDQESIARYFSGRKNVAMDIECIREDSFVRLASSNAIFYCQLEACYGGGDHRIVVGRVIGMAGPEHCGPPLVYHEGRYTRLEFHAETV